MKYLIFDASPISKPKSFSAPFSDTFSWPRLMHLSWIVLDEHYKPIEDYNCIVQPDGFALTEQILDFCKLEEEEVKSKALPLEDILEQFSKSLAQVDMVFAHNMNAAENIVAAEYLRKGIDQALFKVDRYCLMQEGTYFCKLPSKRGGYKWPSLRELHAACFHQGYSPLNNARADVIAASRCFIYLMKTGNLEDLFDDED